MHTVFRLLASAAVVALATTPAIAQYYLYGNGWQQPPGRTQYSDPTRDGTIYRQSSPVMQGPNYDNNQTPPARSKGFGHSNGSYFGW